MDGLEICDITFKISQDGNTNGTTSETEDLEILVEAPLFLEGKGGFFYTLKSDTGWSINDKEELGSILDACKRATEIFIEDVKRGEE